MTYNEFSARDDREARQAELDAHREQAERFLPPWNAEQYDRGYTDRKYGLASPQDPWCKWYRRGWRDAAKESVK